MEYYFKFNFEINKLNGIKIEPLDFMIFGKK